MVYKPTSKEKQTCFICQESFAKERLHRHNHTPNHHAWIEKIKGCEQPHTCYACNVTVIGMKSYNRHYNSAYHRINMKRLHEHKHIDYQFNVTMQEAQSYFASGEERKHVDICYLCFYNVLIQNWHSHVHGYPHHNKMEKLKRGRTHTCRACDMITHSLGDYKKHIKTSTHKNNLEQLKRTRNTREDILIFYSAEIEEFKDVIAPRPEENKNNKPQTNVPNAQCSFQTQSVMGSSTGSQPDQQSFTAHLPMKPSEDGEQPSQSVYTHNASAQEHLTRRKAFNLDKCFLCFSRVPLQHWHLHVQSYQHHCKMETLKRGRTHTCRACDMITHSLDDYKKHIKTSTHKNNLEQLNRTKNTREDILIFYSAEIEEFKDVAQRPEENKSNIPQTNVPNAQWSSQTQSVMGSSTGSQPEQQSFTAHLPMKPSEGGEQPSQPSLRRPAYSPGDEEASHSHLNKRVCVDVPSGNVPQKASAWGLMSNANIQISQVNARGKDPESLRGGCKFSTITVQVPLARAGHEETAVTAKQSHENSSSAPRVYTHNLSAQEHLTRRVCDEHPDQLQVQKLLEQTRSSTTTQRAEIEKDSASVPSEKKQEKSSSRKRKKAPHTDADEAESGQKQLDELMCLSVREEELNQELEKTSHGLFHAYAVLQKTYTHVQHLITAKQQVTSEMSSLRAKRLKILQDMKSCCGDASEIDQQVAPNSS